MKVALHDAEKENFKHKIFPNLALMKISAGYKPGNMAAFMYGSTKRKRKKKVKGK